MTAVIRWLDLADVPPAAWAAWHDLLSVEEAVRASRFLHRADRQSFIAAHALLRVMLSEAAAGTAPQDWRFVAGTHGKPALHPQHGLPALEFNLSHTRGAVACGIAPGCPIGVDIEDETRTADHLAIAKSHFAAAEFSLLRTAAENERAIRFTRLWTLKEAYIKACGQGLSMALDRFAFSLDPIAIRFAEPATESPAAWQFASLGCAGRYRLSVALRAATAIPIRIEQIAPGAIALPPMAAAAEGDQLGEDR